MADPDALTMSRNGTRSGRESVCLPRRIRPWAVPAWPLAVSRTGESRGTYTHHQTG
jgi:hypothetical protein